MTDTDFVVNGLGQRIYVDPLDPRSEALRSTGGDLNPDSLKLWQDLLGSDRWDLVVDVGANYGEMLLGVDLPRLATVIAFEPNEVVAGHLSRSLREAALDVEVRVSMTTLDEALGLLGARRACMKIDVDGAEDLVLQGGQHLLSRLQDLTIQVEILHRTPEQIASWTDVWRVYLRDVRTGGLIRVDGGRVGQLADLLEQPWIYRQDAVLRRIKQP